METYIQNCFCKNCSFNGNVNIVKGKMAEDTSCPNCGNPELEKVTPPARIIPHIENYR